MYTEEMFCSNCKEEMEKVNVDNQAVFHCKNCGASFFEENGINRISEATAQKLSFDKRGNFIFGAEHSCPKDTTVLSEITSDEAVPSTAHLYRCPVCQGIFVQADDLLIFKKAQNAKLQYFKLWNTPLPSVRAVLVAVFVGAISLGMFATYTLQHGNIPTQAENVVQNVHISTSGRYLFISFRTETQYSSSIVFSKKSTKQQTIRVISPFLTSLHHLTISDMPVTDNLYFQIILTDKSGKETRTNEQKLEFK
jgi:hypothetical protein